jgi:hypothetical protein
VTLPELLALTRYWRRRPPVHVAVAAYLGVSTATAAPRTVSAETLAELGAMAGPPLAKLQPRARMQ